MNNRYREEEKNDLENQNLDNNLELLYGLA